MLKLRNRVVARPLSFPMIALAPLAALGGGCGEVDPANSAGADDIAQTALPLGPTAPHYTFCANENQTCVIGGNKLVSFGGGTGWVFKSITGSFTCSPAAFGGSSPNSNGAPRTCSYANYSFMFSESNTPRSGIFNEVAFGIDGEFAFKRVSGTWTCDLQTFPEPSPNTVGKTKACFQAVFPYSRVAAGSTMNGLNKTPLVFGGDGNFVYTTASGSKACTGAAFGSPPLPTVCYRFPYAWVADEWNSSSFTVTQASTLYYGTGSDGNFLSRSLGPGTYTCSNGLAGGDPAPNVGKNCYVTLR